MKKEIRRITKFNILLFITLAVVIGFKLYLTDTIATAGADYSDFQNELTAVRKENENLNNEYHSYTSLHTVEEKALELGLEEYPIDYLTPLELASR